MSTEKPHLMHFSLHEEFNVWPRIECPYEPNDRDRTCLLLDVDISCEGCDDGYDHAEFGHCHFMDGCAVNDYIDAGGWEAVGMELSHGWRYDITEVPVRFNVAWAEGDFPTLVPVDLER